MANKWAVEITKEVQPTREDVSPNLKEKFLETYNQLDCRSLEHVVLRPSEHELQIEQAEQLQKVLNEAKMSPESEQP